MACFLPLLHHGAHRFKVVLNNICRGFSVPLLAVIKSESGQDSSSPSTTPQTCATPTPQGPPTLALAQPQPPRVPPTPTSHAPQLGSPYPLSTSDILAQGMTSVPPPAPMHPGLHPASMMLQSSPALIKVRRNQQSFLFSTDSFFEHLIFDFTTAKEEPEEKSGHNNTNSQ